MTGPQHQEQPTPLLSVEDLTVQLRGESGVVHAVSNVTFRLRRGQTLGIVGESGSGKSVMARALMGLLPRRATRKLDGRVSLAMDGNVIELLKLTEREFRRLRGPQLAMVFQDPMTALNPVLTLGVQIAEPLQLHLGLNKVQAMNRALELLVQVGIPDPEGRLRQYPHQLSGGMRQRVVIAIALACDPQVLLADEPTTALDVTVQRQVLDLLLALQRERKMGMVLITHDLGVVANRSDHIAVMYAGRIVEYAPTVTLFSAMRHPYTEALFKSVPKLSNPSHTRLHAIPGRPPQLIDPAPGCAFAPRCPNAQQRCRRETPGLIPVADEHFHACFYPIDSKESSA